MRASIVINTFNRAHTLGTTLESLLYLDCPDFEVVVVNGPSTDNTEQILDKFRTQIKVAHCPVQNLSVSRNIGIACAAADVVAFIDDDAVPEPEWLTAVLEGYHHHEIGGVGGFVYDHTGYEFQSRYIVCDRFGDATFLDHTDPTALFNAPYSHKYASFMGTNCSFRRDLLLKIGGFDEVYAYFLDETDVCLRIVDLGYKLQFSKNAFIHHKFAASHLRSPSRIVKNYFPNARSRTYFALINTRATHDYYEVIQNHAHWLYMVKGGILWNYENGDLTDAEKDRCLEQLEAGVHQGFQDALAAGERKFLSDTALVRYQSPFKRFQTRKERIQKRVICFLSQDFPPHHNGGIGKWTSELASAIAALGHDVHVITRGKDHPTVDFVDGVWVHRIVPGTVSRTEGCAAPHLEIDLPPAVSDYIRCAYEELLRIEAHRPIDIVSAPIWELEGISSLLDNRFITITTLHTTFQLMLDSHPEWLNHPDYLHNHIAKMIRGERFILERAPFLQSNSRAMIEQLETSYGITLDPGRTEVIPHGIADQSKKHHSFRKDEMVEVLFVGRLECRKGIDTLLSCAASLCKEFPQLRFVIAGDDTLVNERGATYREEYTRTNEDLVNKGRVRFTGKVSEDWLYQLYANCDIFVAPSRFESFGLIFIEAMMFGKPVIGCAAGGMPEVIEHGGNGFLIPPGDAEALGQSLRTLILEEPLRRDFGRRSRERYETMFTEEQMAKAALAYYEQVLRTVSYARRGSDPELLVASAA